MIWIRDENTDSEVHANSEVHLEARQYGAENDHDQAQDEQMMERNLTILNPRVQNIISYSYKQYERSRI